MAASKHFWYGRPIVSQDDIPELERSAAMLEFGHGLNRADAEAHAHARYRVQYHQQAAAHHLRGLRAAQAAGDIEEAQKHGAAYALHMKALGYDPMDAVPPDIRALAEAEEKPKTYKFKSHAGDTFIMPNQK